jgi:hypothetical protein
MVHQAFPKRGATLVATVSRGDSMKESKLDRELELANLVDRKAKAIWDGTHDLEKIGPEMHLGDLHLTTEDIEFIRCRVQWWRDWKSHQTEAKKPSARAPWLQPPRQDYLRMPARSLAGQTGF